MADPDIEARGPFRILHGDDARRLTCTRCVPGGITEALDVLVDATPAAAAERQLAELMDRHLAEAHPPTIPGHFADVRPGWRPLLADLHARLLALDPQYRISGLKEKYGALVVRMASDETREIERAIDDAERESRCVCVFCGARPAWPTAGFAGGILTCCEAHDGRPA